MIYGNNIIKWRVDNYSPFCVYKTICTNILNVLKVQFNNGIFFV
nr:MAG TPA: hypothetical protein [Caudoviricetes sp.]